MADNQRTQFEHHKTHHDELKQSKIEFLPALFLVVALWFLPTGPESAALNALAIIFISIVLEAIPFMFVGALVGGLIETFVSRERLTAFLPRRRWLAVFVAAGAGVVFPVCECAVVPVVRRLVGKGLPLSAAIAYLLGGPIVNPIVAASTALAYAFTWKVVVLRLVLGYGIAVCIGLVMGRLFTKRTAVLDSVAMGSACSHHPIVEDANGDSRLKSTYLSKAADMPALALGGCGCHHTVPIVGWTAKVGSAFGHAVDDFLAVGHYLIIGAFIAALAQTYIDRANFLMVSEVPLLPIGLMMALALLLNLCSEADAFIAASFRGFMPLSAQMAFMLTGPMFDLKLLLMYQRLFRRRAIIVLATLILVVVLGVSVVLEWVYRGSL